MDLPTSEQVQRMLRRPPTYTIDEIDRAPDPTQLIPARTGSGSKPTPAEEPPQEVKEPESNKAHPGDAKGPSDNQDQAKQPATKPEQVQEQTNEPGTEVPKKVEERKEPDSNKPHSSDDKDPGDKQATTTDAGNKQPAAKLQQVKTEPAEEATRRKENPEEEEEEERLQKEAHASYMRYFRSIRPLVCVSSPFELEAITLILIPVLMWFSQSVR